MKRIYVINSRGQKEPFSFKKVYNSCKRAGASDVLAQEIALTIKRKIYPGIKTSKIFEQVKQKLSEKSPRSVIRISLKEAIRKLGPEGFDFEKYIAEVFLRNGFDVKINQEVPGFCISSYEIDFLAEKKDLVYVGECKYHHLAGGRIALKVALSNYARFLDIEKGVRFKNSRLKTILVTNTKFTTEVIKYAKCMDVELLGWRYPPEKGLESMVERLNLYPVTILPSFKSYFKSIFAKRRMMLVLDILETPLSVLSRRLNIPKKNIENLIKEAKVLLGEN